MCHLFVPPNLRGRGDRNDQGNSCRTWADTKTAGLRERRGWYIIKTIIVVPSQTQKRWAWVLEVRPPDTERKNQSRNKTDNEVIQPRLEQLGYDERQK